MKKTIIPALALMVALMVGGPFPACALLADAASSAAADRAGYAAAMEQYDRQLADYKKDLAAYEADPGEWTAEIPRMPARPAIPETGNNKKQPLQQSGARQ